MLLHTKGIYVKRHSVVRYFISALLKLDRAYVKK